MSHYNYDPALTQPWPSPESPRNVMIQPSVVWLRLNPAGWCLRRDWLVTGWLQWGEERLVTSPLYSPSQHASFSLSLCIKKTSNKGRKIRGNYWEIIKKLTINKQLSLLLITPISHVSKKIEKLLFKSIMRKIYQLYRQYCLHTTTTKHHHNPR